jgi:hypothetical protein
MGQPAQIPPRKDLGGRSASRTPWRFPQPGLGLLLLPVEALLACRGLERSVQSSPDPAEPPPHYSASPFRSRYRCCACR